MSKIEVVEKTELQHLVDRYLALPEEQRSKIVVINDLECLLRRRYGDKGVSGGTPVIVSEVERVIDERPCEPLRPEDFEHEERPFQGSGSHMYTGGGGLVGPYEAASDPQRPLDDAVEPSPLRIYLMPSSWWQHLKCALAKRWPRVFGRLTVLWTKRYAVPR